MSLRPQTSQRVDGIIARAQADGRVPSLIAGVIRGGELVHVSGAGHTPPPHPDLQYRIGSISKTMTAALILALRDQGLLALADPVERHLPGTPVGELTIRQLLTHTGGLQREPDSPQWWERSPGPDMDAMLAELTPGKLAHPPEHGHHYSNLAYGLLGAVLRRVSGQPWPALLRKRLLDPLGMDRTTYHPVEPFARGYVVHPWHGTLREEPRHDAGAMAPAGQLWSTVADLARWAAFLADPDPAVLAPGTVARMCSPVVISDPDRWSAGQGLGVQQWRHGERIYAGHGGSMPGYLATLMVHRPTRTGVVAFANCYGFHTGGIGSLGLDLLDAVLDGEPEPVRPWTPATPPPPQVEPLCGRWWWMGHEYEATWDADNGDLVLRALGMPAEPWRFAAAGPDRWRGRAGTNDGEDLWVRRDGDGRVRALDIATFVFTRDPDTVA